MKKFLAIVMSFMLITASFYVGCGPQKPIIELSTDEREVEVNFVSEYELPTARCKSAINKKKLDVEITAVDSRGKEAEVRDGYLYPTNLLSYYVHYNAKEKEGKMTPAEEVIYTIKFVDNGPVITESKKIQNFTKINTFTEYAIPEFDDVAEISYDLYGWKNEDFTSTRTASYLASGEEEPVQIENPDLKANYDLGVITIDYVISPKANPSMKTNYQLVVEVGDVLFNSLVDKGEVNTNCEKEFIFDEAIKPEGPILKISTTLNEGMWPNAWPGVKLDVHNSLFDALNKKPGHSIVLKCYNPTEYWGKFYFSAYDDKDFTGKKGAYKTKYRVAPHEYFDIILPKDSHIGKVNIFELSFELRSTIDPDILAGIKEPFHANELYIISTEIVSEAEISTRVWDDKNAPILKAYTSDSNLYEHNQTVISKATANEVGVDGILVERKDSSNSYIDFLSDPASYDMIMDNFAKIHRSHRYARYLSFKVTNLKADPFELSVNMGYKVNNQEYEDGSNYMNKITVPGNGSIKLYLGADTRNDKFDLDTVFDMIRLNAYQESKFVISDVNILDYGTDTKADLAQWEIKKIPENHTEEKLAVRPGSTWTIPAFADLYTSNNSAEGVVESVKYYSTLDGDKTDVDTVSVKAEKGYYDVNYIVTETKTGFTRKVSATFTCIGASEVTQRIGTEGYNTAAYGERYIIPEFDTLYRLDAKHSAVIKSVEYCADDTAEWQNAPEFSVDKIDVKPGNYKVTYLVTLTDSGEQINVYYEIKAQGKIDFSFFVADKPEYVTFSESTYNDQPAVEVSVTKDWKGVNIYDKELIEAFNNAGDDAFIYVKGVNISNVKNYLCFFYGDMDYKSGDGMHYCAYPKPNEEFTVLVPREVTGIKHDYFNISIVDPEMNIKITEVGMTYLDRATTEKAFDINEEFVNGIDFKDKDNAKASLAEGGFKIKATGSTNTNLLSNPALKSEFDTLYNGESRFTTVLKVKVTNTSDKLITVNVGLGIDGITMVVGPLRDQEIPANSTRTYYVTYAMVEKGELKDSQVNTLQINVDASTDDIIYNSFEFVKFA